MEQIEANFFAMWANAIFSGSKFTETYVEIACLKHLKKQAFGQKLVKKEARQLKLARNLLPCKFFTKIIFFYFSNFINIRRNRG